MSCSVGSRRRTKGKEKKEKEEEEQDKEKDEEEVDCKFFYKYNKKRHISWNRFLKVSLLQPNATFVCQMCSGKFCADAFLSYKINLTYVTCQPGEICWVRKIKQIKLKNFFLNI